MSRCFPYLPPGFENNIQYNENYLSKKEKKKGKKNRKEKDNKEGKEKKRKVKDESKPKQKEKKNKGSDTNTEGGEGKNCIHGGVQVAGADSRETEFPNGLIVADNHTRGGNRIFREVYQNPRDSNIIPAGVYGSNHYYNSGDKFGTNSLHASTGFVRESTKNIRVVNRSGGQLQQQPNVRNGFRNGEHLGPNHLHFPTKSGHRNLVEPEWNDRSTNSSDGECARTYAYCNGDGPIHNHDHFVENKHQRHIHEHDMKRRPLTKPVSVIMDRKLSSPVTEIHPSFGAAIRQQRPIYNRMEETRSIVTGQKNNAPRPCSINQFHHEMSDYRRSENDTVKPGEDVGSGIQKGDSMGKRKREDEKHISKEEKAMRKQEKSKRKEEAKSKKREEKAKNKEIAKLKLEQLPSPMELDSSQIIQIPRILENHRTASPVNVIPTIRPDYQPRETMEDDSDKSTEKVKNMDRLLYKFPPLPEMEHVLPPTDEQDWLFNDSGGFRLSSRNLSPPKQVEVWAETLRIESADVYALPYVIPY